MGEAETFPHERINIFEEMMKTTMTLSQTLHCSPFEIFEQDSDEVIMLINFYLLLAKNNPDAKTTTPKSVKKEQRIKVNDKTASGGWW